MAIEISMGLTEAERGDAAWLFWCAFAPKLGRLLGPEPRALAYLSRALIPAHTLCARDAAGRLVGLAGIKTVRGGLIGGDLSSMARVYGWLGALWRGPILEMTDKAVGPSQMSLDGICVAPDLRGQGIGGALIDGAIRYAKERGLSQIWLEVVDTNPRARALYLRTGFAPGKRTQLGLLRWVFGFREAEAMVLNLD